eukprot:GDKJ01003966.1.p2 GENE.GDKJ01003966.1~~GDKJ01003966.1.p2  ORF type:complete len:297 (-),score=86.94 GDKJ01003966.1:365-1255(-)
MFGMNNIARTTGFATAQQARNFGANIKALSMRMKSVKNVQKITKAMKMVAASKLKHDQRRLEAGTPFARATTDLFKIVPIPEVQSPITVLALSSDKGLCGGVNSYVAKAARLLVAEEEAKGNKATLYGFGDKIRAATVRLFGDRFGRMNTEVTNKAPWNFTAALALTERLVKDDPDRITVIYNKFKSAIQYDTLKVNILTPKGASKADLKALDQYEFEPERSDIWQDLLEWNMASSIFGYYLDNCASEQSARMSAMDNASKNAGELLGSLTIEYNKARQSKITMELIEIISGANAL